MVIPDALKKLKLAENFFNDGWHKWYPDGKWLEFDSSNDVESFYYIILMNWETKEVKQLKDSTFHYYQAPAFVEIN